MRNIFRIGLFLFFLLSPLWADTVYMEDGRVIRGEIVYEDSYGVRVKTKYGIIRLEKGEIQKIVRIKSPQELHEERIKKCRTVDDYYKLGVWAKEKKLFALSVRDFGRALELDSSHEKAHKALGHTYHQGRWWTEEEYNEKVKGLVYRDGKWISKEKAEKLDARLIKERAERVKVLWKKRKQELKGVPWPQALQKPIESAHYIVYCNSSQEVAKLYSDFLEQLFTTFDRIFKYYRPVYSQQIQKQKSVVMIHRSYEEFLNMHALPPGVGGFYRPKGVGSIPGRTVVAFHGSFGDTGNTYSVLAHEGTHQFQHLVMPDIMNRPTWLIEGLAVFFGDGHEINSRGKLKVGVIPRDRLSTLREAIKKGTYIRLKDLFRTSHARFSGFHYAHGWGVIYYMLDPEKRLKDKKLRDKRRKMQQVFQKFFDLNCRTELAKDPIQNTNKMAVLFEGMIKKELGLSLADFERDWKEFILSLELDPVGEIKAGTQFSSPKMKFKVTKPPKYSWKFDLKNLQSGEKVAISNKTSTGRIGIVARGNMFMNTSEEMAQNIRYRMNQSFSSLQFLGAKKIYHKGYEGYRFSFRGFPRQTVNTGVVRKTEQQYELYILATLDNIYMVKFQADADKFDENQKIFKWVLDRFEITH